MLALRTRLEEFANPLRRANRAQMGWIGLDFALQEMHLVQLQKQSNGDISLHSFVSIPYPDSREKTLAAPKLLAGILQPVLKKNRFSGRSVVTAMPAKQVRVIPVTYPHVPNQAVEHAVVKALRERVSEDLDQYVMDYLPVRGSANEETHLAVVAMARRDEVIDYLECLRKAGLDVQALEIGPSAIKRLVSAMACADQYANVLVVNIGQLKSYLTIISGRRLLLDQHIDLGEKHIVDSIAKTLDMGADEVWALVHQHGLASDPQARDANSEQIPIDIAATLREIIKPLFMRLTEEINRILIYAAAQTRGQPVNQIYLIGGVARWRGADLMLRQLLDINVRTIPDPLDVLSTQRDDAPRSNTGHPQLVLATGLALRGIVDG